MLLVGLQHNRMKGLGRSTVRPELRWIQRARVSIFQSVLTAPPKSQSLGSYHRCLTFYQGLKSLEKPLTKTFTE
jgi:hypothetical protein